MTFLEVPSLGTLELEMSFGTEMSFGAGNMTFLEVPSLGKQIVIQP